jgi:hypothetical protein
LGPGGLWLQAEKNEAPRTRQKRNRGRRAFLRETRFLGEWGENMVYSFPKKEAFDPARGSGGKITGDRFFLKALSSKLRK